MRLLLWHVPLSQLLLWELLVGVHWLPIPMLLRMIIPHKARSVLLLLRMLLLLLMLMMLLLCKDVVCLLQLCAVGPRLLLAALPWLLPIAHVIDTVLCL